MRALDRTEHLPEANGFHHHGNYAPPLTSNVMLLKRRQPALSGMERRLDPYRHILVVRKHEGGLRLCKLSTCDTL